MLPTASFTIAQLLSGPFLLNIPPYQRPYAWNEDNAEQLFDDLMEAALDVDVDIKDHGYFLGTILLMDNSLVGLSELSVKMSPREFDVVDGQQRFVTLMTLLAVLRDADGAKNSAMVKRTQSMFFAQEGSMFRRTERSRLHLSGSDRRLFETGILPVGATANAYFEDPMNASDGAASNLLKVREKLRQLAGELSVKERNILFDVITQNAYVTTIVSTNIDRAHRMFVVLNERGRSLQRNDILKADILSRLSGQDVAEIAIRWDRLSADLGNDFEAFFSHLRTIYGQTRPQVVSAVRAIISESGGAKPFFENVLEPFAETYALIRTAGVGVLPDPMQRTLQYLSRLADADWAPAAMLALKDWKRDPDYAAMALSEIDRFAHVMRLLCAGNGKRVRRFTDVVAALRGSEPVSEDHAAFQLTREELRSIAFHMKDLHKRNPRICKLLLLRLSDELDGRTPLQNPARYTIEHVLPQRPSPTSEWRQEFPDAEVRARCTECLGNLALITQGQNDRARNALWTKKREIYEEAIPVTPILAITRDVLEQPKWDVATVDERTRRLLAIVERMWRIDLQSGAATQPAGKNGRLTA